MLRREVFADPARPVSKPGFHGALHEESQDRLFAASLTALVALAAPFVSQAQSTYDDTQQLIAQIQTDKRAIVLKAMALDDAQMTAFTPIYDEYQAKRKKLMQRGVDLVDAYASNYDSMTDDAAKKLLKDWFALPDDETKLVKATSKKLDKVLPTTKVLRFVQIENKLNTVLRLPARPRHSARPVTDQEATSMMQVSYSRRLAAVDGARRRCRFLPPVAPADRTFVPTTTARRISASTARTASSRRPERDTAEFRSLATQTLQAAASREMEARGYTRSDNPDLADQLQGQARGEDRHRVDAGAVLRPGWVSAAGTARPTGGYGGTEVTTRRYKVGTLVMDVIDREKRQAVFQGGIEGVVTKEMMENKQGTS